MLLAPLLLSTGMHASAIRALVGASADGPRTVELSSIFTAGEKNAAGFPVFGYRIPGFVAANGGSNGNGQIDTTLVVLAEARKYSCSDEGAHDLVAKRSTDMGKSWGRSQTVIDPAKLWGAQEGGKKGGAVYDPTPVYDDTTGKIHVIFSYCPARYMSRPPISQAFELWEVTSEDRGLTWGAPRNLSAILPSKTLAPDEPKWCIRTGAGGGNGIQLAHGPKSGRLVVPGYHSFCPPSPVPPPPPTPDCTPAKAQAIANRWCNRPGTWCNAKGTRFALRGEGKTGSAGTSNSQFCDASLSIVRLQVSIVHSQFASFGGTFDMLCRWCGVAVLLTELPHPRPQKLPQQFWLYRLLHRKRPAKLNYDQLYRYSTASGATARS